MAARLEDALARHRIICTAALIVLGLGAWVYLIAGAGLSTVSVIGTASMRHPSGTAMAGMAMTTSAQVAAAAWSLSHFVATFTMWWVMMVAMMLPSAAPMILLYGRVAAGRTGELKPASGSFLSGYLLAWGAFSIAAALIDIALEQSDVFSPSAMALHSHLYSGALLIAAGAYQLSPVKDACLRQCQSPARFLSRHFKPGWVGALRMGLHHGAICIGCCWMLMTLLFVGGVMNLAWIAALTLLVAAEKLLPLGRTLSVVIGTVTAGLGLVLLASQHHVRVLSGDVSPTACHPTEATHQLSCRIRRRTIDFADNRSFHETSDFISVSQG